MDISHRRFHRVDLLTLDGRLDAASAPHVQQALDNLFLEGRYRIVLDLEKLNHISSAGLRVLVEARKRAREWKLTDLEGGDIRVANMPRKIREVFDLTGLTTLFEIYGDPTEAVGSF
jgi:anti-sigma B factor antagonist